MIFRKQSAVTPSTAGHDQLPVGLIAQLDKPLHWYPRGHEFESRPSQEFSPFSFILLPSPKKTNIQRN